MATKEQFKEAVLASYKTEKPHIFLGCGVLDGEILKEARVNIPLSMMNRHGMVAGATGSGKTRTLQLLAEQLSNAGVPVFLSDIKGDISGLIQPGQSNARIEERVAALGMAFQAQAIPVEFYSLSGNHGAQMRATVIEFGPILLAKVLELNDTQTSVLSVIFKYADDYGLPILDMKDLKQVISFVAEKQGEQEMKDNYGSISGATTGTILRKIVALEQQGVQHLFGEPSFDIQDLLQTRDGKGVVSLLNVSDMQDKPAVFSTFMLSLLAELYQTLPEAGDLDKPKLVFFLDEAHLLFRDASKAFLQQIEQIIRLIRSKGVGVFFCSQMAQDLPESVLSQLGNRIQHVLRAFTPNDAKALRDTIKTYPRSNFYAIDETLQKMGIGQALITVLNEKGIPTEVVHTHLVPPVAHMGPADARKVEMAMSISAMHAKYKETVDSYSAHEMLSARTAYAEKIPEPTKPLPKTKPAPASKPRTTKAQPSAIEQVLKSPVAKTLGQEIVRGIFGVLFGKSSGTRRR